MNLKDLNDKRKGLWERGVELRSKNENGELSKEETAELRSLVDNIKGIDEQIKAEEELRNITKKDNEKGKGKVMAKEISKNEAEVRSLELYLRNRQNTEEFRDLSMTAGNDVDNTAGNGGITVPTSVASDIIKKLTEESGVFNLVNKIPSQSGRLKVPRERKSPDDAVLVGEGDSAAISTATWTSVSLDQKRVAAAFQLTNELINDSAVSVVNYAVDYLSRSVARAIERQVLLGKDVAGNAGFRPVTEDADVVKKTVDLKNLVPEDLIGAYTSLGQAYQAGAVWVVSKKAFEAMAQLKDGDQTLLIFRALTDGHAGYYFLGAPVFISDVLDGSGHEIVLGNFPLGYSVMIKKGMNLTHVTADSRQALMGGHLVVLDAYMDGAVVNPDAFIVVDSVATSTTTTSK